MTESEHPFDRVARELDVAGTSAMALAPSVDLVFTVADSEHHPGEQVLHTELITGQFHKATLKLSSTPVRPSPDTPWGGGVFTAVCEVWAALNGAIRNFALASAVLDPLIPDDEDGEESGCDHHP